MNRVDYVRKWHQYMASADIQPVHSQPEKIVEKCVEDLKDATKEIFSKDFKFAVLYQVIHKLLDVMVYQKFIRQPVT